MFLRKWKHQNTWTPKVESRRTKKTLVKFQTQKLKKFERLLEFERYLETQKLGNLKGYLTSKVTLKVEARETLKGYSNSKSRRQGY